MRIKGRYFSVRFSAELLDRIIRARLELYGDRCTLAEAIRRLIEDRLDQLAAGNDGEPITNGAPESSPPRSSSLSEYASARADSEVGASLIDTSPNAGHLKRLANSLRRKAAEIVRTSVDLETILLQPPLSAPRVRAETLQTLRNPAPDRTSG